MCFSLKTLGRTSSQARQQETCSDSPLPHSGTLNVIGEYESTVRTESYEVFCNRVRRLSGHAIEENGQASDRAVLRYSGFLDDLLDPDQESVNAVIQRLILSRKSEFFKLISDYFDNSRDAYKICGIVQRSICEAKLSYGKINTILGVMPTAGEFGEEQCRWIIEEFRLFVEAENPFADPISESFHNCLRDLLKEMELSRTRAEMEPKWTRRFKTVYALCVHRISPPVLIDFVKGRLRPCNEERKQLDAAVRGCYVLSNHVDTMSRLIARLRHDVEHNKVVMRFCLDRRHERPPVEEVVRALRKNDANFIQRLDELEEYVCLCLMNINRARSLLLGQIHMQQHEP